MPLGDPWFIPDSSLTPLLDMRQPLHVASTPAHFPVDHLTFGRPMSG